MCVCVVSNSPPIPTQMYKRYVTFFNPVPLGSCRELCFLTIGPAIPPKKDHSAALARTVHTNTRGMQCSMPHRRKKTCTSAWRRRVGAFYAKYKSKKTNKCPKGRGRNGMVPGIRQTPYRYIGFQRTNRMGIVTPSDSLWTIKCC